MTEKVEIIINTNPKINLRKIMIIPAMQLVLIGIGVIVGSTAMQWMGFVMFWILLLAISIVNIRRESGLTIEEAKKLIEELEKNEVED